MSKPLLPVVALAGIAAGGAVAWWLARRPEPTPPATTTPAVATEAVPDDDLDVEDEGEEIDGETAVMQAKAKICKKLACTDAQRGQLGALIRQFRDETRDRRTEVKNLRASVAEAWGQPQADASRIAELDGRMATLESEIEASARATLLSFHSGLDDEQRRKLSRWLRRKSARELLQDKRTRADDNG
ncbi:MAG: periplasmic heavy metal sensor [Nannocystaceae bacterium]|nr:periplasmic heavy metal sensor [Nannocystaceae bacterium]